MKSIPALPAALLPAIFLTSCLLLAGCGQTGALYLPKPLPKPAGTQADIGKPGVAPPSSPVPATPPASQQ